MKEIIWVGSSLADLKTFPNSAKQEAGFQLHTIQNGRAPSDWKPMKTIGRGVREIRIKVDGQFRIIYITTIGDAIYVLHAFQKKTQKTEKKDIDLAQQRFKEIKNA